MRRPPRTPPLPFGTSEQRLAPELHQRLEAELRDRRPQLEAEPREETRRRNTVGIQPNPRYQLIHDPGTFPSHVPYFTLTFRAQSPSAALHLGHYIAHKLGVSLCLYDRATHQVTALAALSAADD